MEITKYKKSHPGYSQISGMPLTIAILDKDNEELHAPVQCKDYLQDAFWSEHTGKDVDIYGFKWKPGMMSVKESRYRFGLRYNAVPPVDKLKGLLKMWAEATGLGVIRVYETTKEKEIVVTVSASWVDMPIKISLLAFLFRTAPAYEEGGTFEEWLKKVQSGSAGVSGADKGYAIRAEPRLKVMFAERKFPAQEWSQFKGSGEIHNSSGICNAPWDVKLKMPKYNASGAITWD